MLWLEIVGGLCVLVVTYLVIAGNTLPREHVTSVRAAFHRAPGELWAAITRHAEQPAWRKDLRSLEMLPPRDGKTVFREVAGFGPVTYIVDEAVAPRRYVVRILDEDLGYGGTWTFELTPEGPDGAIGANGPDGVRTRLTITEKGVMKSVMFRALAPFFSKSATLENYVKALGAKLGEGVTVEVVRPG